MRTALILLFLLALAAIPGSVFPQRLQNLPSVNQYLKDNPTWGPVMDRLGLFEVYGSPWFAATYVLLFVSLVGCVLPRSWQHVRTLRQPPPVAPRFLTRLPEHRTLESDAAPQDVLDVARARLRSRRWRVRTVAYDPGRPAAAGSPPRRAMRVRRATCCSTWRCWGFSPRWRSDRSPGSPAR